MQPEGPQEITTSSLENSLNEAGQNQQAEIESISNTFSNASRNLNMDLGSIIDANPEIDFSEEQSEITENSTKLKALLSNNEVNEWAILEEEETEVRVGEETPKIQFKNKNLSMVHDLIKSGAITGEPSQEPGYSWNRDYTVDVKKAEEIIEKAEGNTESESTSEQEKERLKSEAIRMYPEIIGSFKEAGVLTDELEVQLGRLLKAENIEVEDIDFHHFYYSGEGFPEKSEDEPVLRLGTGQLKHMEHKLTEIFSSANISLEQSQIQKIALRWGLSHEMGHAAERAMKLRLYEGIKDDKPEKDFLKEEMQLDSKMESDIEEVISPDDDLDKIRGLLGGDKKFRIGSWTPERVAGGFEFVGLKSALGGAGLNNEQSTYVLKHLQDLNEEFLSENTRIFEQLKEVGIKDYDLKAALYEIKRHFRDSGNTELAEKLPNLNLGSIGYARPLNEAQTKAYVAKYSNNA